MPAPKLARRRLAGVILFGVLLIAQGVYSFAVEPEPYPAIRMPSFGAAPTRDGLFPSRVVSITVTYVDGSTENPRVYEIMNGVRFSAARPALNFAFAPGKAIDDATRTWLRDRAREVGRGADPARVEICWQDAAVEVRNAHIVNAKPCEMTVVAF